MQQDRDARAQGALNDFVETVAEQRAKFQNKAKANSDVTLRATQAETELKAIDAEVRAAKKRVDMLELESARLEGQANTKRGELATQSQNLKSLRQPRLQLELQADERGAAFAAARDAYIDGAMALVSQAECMITKNDPVRLQGVLQMKQKQANTLRERVALLKALNVPKSAVVPSRAPSHDKSSKTVQELTEDLAAASAVRREAEEQHATQIAEAQAKRGELRTKLGTLCPEIENVDRAYHVEQKEYSDVIDALTGRACDVCGKMLSAETESASQAK